jgi:FAD-dependent oxidoreductase domain-containing protein 1
MFNRAITGVQLKPWLKSKYLVQSLSFPVRSFCNSQKKYSKKGDESDKPLSNVVPDFQSELFEETRCPPLTQPLKPFLHPIKRSFDYLGITGRNDPQTHNNLYFPRHCDIVIIGGGIMGCSIAYWLKQRGHDNGLRVIVVERDPNYTRASTVLSVGGLRQQFSLPENIQMSLFGAEFLRNAKRLLSGENLEGPDVQFHPYGYLFLATQKGADQLIENHKLQT